MKFGKTARKHIKKMMRTQPWIDEGEFKGFIRASLKKRELERDIGEDNIFVRIRYKGEYGKKKWIVQSRMISKAMKEGAMATRHSESTNIGYCGEYATKKGRGNIRRREKKYEAMKKNRLIQTKGGNDA
tara:strand:+ start:323 stop:709 length:387 start_codon:yes stop_codon:yes gene_type:complete